MTDMSAFEAQFLTRAELIRRFHTLPPDLMRAGRDEWVRLMKGERDEC